MANGTSIHLVRLNSFSLFTAPETTGVLNNARLSGIRIAVLSCCFEFAEELSARSRDKRAKSPPLFLAKVIGITLDRTTLVDRNERMNISFYSALFRFELFVVEHSKEQHSVACHFLTHVLMIPL